MKKHIAVVLLLGVGCFAAMISAVSADKPVPISEHLGLRPIDPTPIAGAFVSPDNASFHPHCTIEPKDWQLTNAEYLTDGVLEMSHKSIALSNFISVQPECYLFQIDQKTVPAGRSLVTVGDASFGCFHDAMYANWNPDWMTFSHFFRIPEAENQMQFGLKRGKLGSDAGYMVSSADSYGSESTVHFKNLKLLPAQALLNLAPKEQPLKDIYWGINAVSRTEPTGVFLPLGRMESMDKDFKTNQSVYHFRMEKNGADPWGLYPSRMETTVYPSASNEARPIEKMIAMPQFSKAIQIDEMILKFEFRPISIGDDGEFNFLPPIRLLSARLEGNFLDNDEKLRDGIFWSTDGKTWKNLSIEIKMKDGRRDLQNWPPALPEEIFPCERLYLKFVPTIKTYESHLNWLRFHAVLDTDQYYDYGQTSYFRVVPGETKESYVKVWPLYTKRNQVYFLFRNDSANEVSPEFSARLGYAYSGQTQPKEVIFRASGNTVEAFDDVACHWEIIGKDAVIPPDEERICVFTLETSKLRASSHAQRGPYVSDVFQVEFDLGTYKMLNEQMRFFPPRLAIE